MASLQMRDVSHAGHELGRAHLDDLPRFLTLGDLLRTRVRTDVARYNAAPGPVFEGLVQPADAVRHSDGHHLPTPRPLDADPFVAAAEEAVAVGLLWFLVDDEVTSDLDRRIDVDQQVEIVAVLRRSIVARSG